MCLPGWKIVDGFGLGPSDPVSDLIGNRIALNFVNSPRELGSGASLCGGRVSRVPQMLESLVREPAVRFHACSTAVFRGAAGFGHTQEKKGLTP
jgi:hypothetical protein